jgi:hypothetical protein
MRNISFLLCSVGAAGCLVPPPGETAAVPSPAEPAPASVPGNLSKPLVVWNGDDVKPTSRSWSACDSKPCISVAEALPKVGAKGTVGLEYRVETSKGWAGFGWNWTSWHVGGASNVVGRKKLKLMLQIQAESPELAPEPDAIQIGLRCAKAKACGVGLAGIGKYEPAATDGQWHEVSIPLEDMKPEKAAIWDPGSVWEITIGGGATAPKKFVIHLDDIRFE